MKAAENGSADRDPSGLPDTLAHALTAGGTFTTEWSARADHDESFPDVACAILDGLGLAAAYVPTTLGGTWSDHERLLRLVRAVAAHDITVAVAHMKTFLGSVSVWLSGDDAQCARLADVVLAGRPVSWALSEPDHGADLLSGEVTALRVPGGYELNGVKWLINNATRSDQICVLARTDPVGGGRGHSLFLVDKARLAEGGYEILPKFRTVGIRGADISGIAFHHAVIAEDTMVGPEGTGVETVLRALQLTRVAATGLSLGAAEHALRLSVRFASERIIQDRPLIERPIVRHRLVRCLGVLLAAEAACTLAARSVHTLTEELSIVSAVVKAAVPTWIDWVIKELAELLGARSFLLSAFADGMFQKLQRDHQIVAIFDGSTLVNRAALIGQFPRLVRGYAEGREDATALALTADLGREVPPLDATRLVLSATRGCSAVQALPRILSEEEGNAEIPFATDLKKCLDELHEGLSRVSPSPFPSVVAFELAEAYEAAYAAAACLHLWQGGRGGRVGWWLPVTLAELLPRMSHGPSEPGSGHVSIPATEAAMDWLLHAVAEGAPLSLRSLLAADEGVRP